MNILSQPQQSAKESALNRQKQNMIALYTLAGDEDRAAVIRNVDSFLSMTAGDERRFWLSFRHDLERLNEKAG